MILVESQSLQVQNVSQLPIMLVVVNEEIM